MQSRYFNRELSLLDFQERVLAIAQNPNVPLLERVKFVAIVASNLDEFFQVRVAGIAEQEATGVGKVTADGMTPSEQLIAIRKQVESLVDRLEHVFVRELRPALAEAGIRITGWGDLDEEERAQLYEVFSEQIYPILTPLAFDPQHPFPFISNLSLNLAVRVRNPATGALQFARVKMPMMLPRFLQGTDPNTFVPIEQVVAAFIDGLFPGMEIVGAYPFRVTRSADQAVEEEEAEDLLLAMEELLQTRYRFSRLVRLEVDASMPQEVLDLLVTEMGIDHSFVFVHKDLLALSGLWSVFALDRPELKDPVWVPVAQPELTDTRGGSILERVREGDRLVHMPYDAFGPSIGAFIAQAARDPDVVAIKQTLYRTSDPEDPAIGGEASIVKSLMTAAQAGKQVVVLVELKARFDEEANITWARMLEDAGVHVVYGVAGLKTHAKTALVVRREGGRLRRYCHIGTGNYNPKTARLYEDVGLFTADEDLGADLSELFNVLTGYSRRHDYRKLLVAPTTLRGGIVERIRRQAALGPQGRIAWKLNHLVDPEIIDELYAASAAGTPVDLVVRGICCLRPGVADLSDTIRVRSIVGEFLEHSRIMRFGSGDDAEYLTGSADMMQRNLNGRVEAVTPIEDPRIRRRLDEIIEVSLADDSLAYQLGADGSWTKVPTVTGMNLQQRMKALALARRRGAEPDPEIAVVLSDVVVAGGGLVNRLGDSGPEVLIVHRPRYDDWSFPKGKVQTGESEADTALREVSEETGLDCELGPEIGQIEYVDHEGSRKVVRYWAMEPVRGEFTPNDEVDSAAWLGIDDALQQLSYDRDRALLRAWLGAVQ